MNINTTESPFLSDRPEFYAVLEHAVAQAHNILDACGDDDETIENSTATVGCAFLLDLIHAVLELAVVYEDFDPSDIQGFLDIQKQYGSVFKNESVH